MINLCDSATNIPSVAKLPGVVRDRLGNLNIQGEDLGKGLRHRYEFILKLPLQSLSGIKLSELLDWMRWGSEEGCLWEFRAEELFELIDHWESANPQASANDYGAKENSLINDWEEFWKQHHATAFSATRMIRCVCGNIFESDKIFCPDCDKSRLEGKTEWKHLTRGLGHYNLAISGGGSSFAQIAWATRGKLRLPPADLQTPL